jgi:hypothetical protein
LSALGLFITLACIPADTHSFVPEEELRSLVELRRLETSVLELVSSRRFGPQLFLVDPVRFLREAGWSVAETLESELAEKRAESPEPGRYERVEEGVDPLCEIDVKFTRLGVPEDFE